MMALGLSDQGLDLFDLLGGEVGHASATCKSKAAAIRALV